MTLSFDDEASDRIYKAEADVYRFSTSCTVNVLGLEE